MMTTDKTYPRTPGSKHAKTKNHGWLAAVFSPAILSLLLKCTYIVRVTLTSSKYHLANFPPTHPPDILPRSLFFLARTSSFLLPYPSLDRGKYPVPSPPAGANSKGGVLRKEVKLLLGHFTD